jgi:7-carboxy-7-deazaguanine synthase
VKNLQPPEKRVRDPQHPLEVHSIFYTIQGEGPFAGTPAVFIRLSGCNLQCPGCDTDYTSARMRLQHSLVLEMVNNTHLAHDCKWPGLVVITGGEPFRQDLTKLIRMLVTSGYYVQIETNGTFPPPTYSGFNSRIDLRKGAYIVCSPKTGKVHARVQKEACCYKYVMDYRSVDNDGLPVLALDHTASPRLARPPESMPVYLQPRDDKDPVLNRLHLEACIASCMKHGYTLQLQIHKIIGME